MAKAFQRIERRPSMASTISEILRLQAENERLRAEIKRSEARCAAMDAEKRRLDAQSAALDAEKRRLLTKCAALEAKKKRMEARRAKSARSRSGNRSGGQPGQSGATLQ